MLIFFSSLFLLFSPFAHHNRPIQYNIQTILSQDLMRVPHCGLSQSYHFSSQCCTLSWCALSIYLAALRFSYVAFNYRGMAWFIHISAMDGTENVHATQPQFCGGGEGNGYEITRRSRRLNSRATKWRKDDDGDGKEVLIVNTLMKPATLLNTLAQFNGLIIISVASCCSETPYNRSTQASDRAKASI